MCQKAPSPPPAPDYAAAATAQGQANLTSAQQGAILSNPNVNGPYGSQNVSYSNYTGPNGQTYLQPNVTQQLTPEAEASLQDQQQVQHSLANLALQGAGTAQGVLGTPFQYNGPQINANAPNVGSPQFGPPAGFYGFAQGFNPNAYGQAGSVNPNAYGQAGAVNPMAFGQARGVNAGPSAQGSIDTSQLAKMPVNAGTTAQQAILSRLDPEIAQTEAATQQRLANQGIMPGSEAYNNEMRVQNQQENDLRTQAALQGIGVDMSANQQGYNQEMGQAGLYNEALGQNLNAALASAQSRNAAIAQNYGAAANAMGQRNAAIGQNYGQGVTAQELQNAAIGQNAGLGLEGVNSGNAAIAQNYGQGQSAAGLYNQALSQQFNQNLAGEEFGNTAAQQAYEMQLAQRNQPLNEIAALMSGSQINVPQFQSYQGQNVAPAPIFSAAQAQNQDAMNRYGIAMNNYNSQMSGLFGLGGAVLGAAGNAGGFGQLLSMAAR